MCFEKPKEECGIFGIYNKSSDTDTAKTVYYALFSLQHRGQESCGIAIQNEMGTNCIKDLGLVSEVFDDTTMSTLRGDVAIGHVRYSTTGASTRENAQPLTSKYMMGALSIVHNGSICNAGLLRSELEQDGVIFQTTGDSEIVSILLARERIKMDNLEQSIINVMKRIRGSYSMLVMAPNKLIAVRDPLGIRPLCFGRMGESYVFASESCALNSAGAEFVRDIKPGELVTIADGEYYSTDSRMSRDSALCIFEHIYFARTDSVIDGQSVYAARLNAGKVLAEESPADADLVIGVPDSGIVAAIGYSQRSGIPYAEGFVKNRYIGRTFIQPAQDMRNKSIHIKLSALRCNVNGKRVVMVDDSIVRGSNVFQVVAMLKEAGAKEVHVRISCPEFLWPCFFGTDISDRAQLASVKYSVSELKERIGADSLAFLPLGRLREIAPDSSLSFCSACFSGDYPMEVPLVR